MVFNKCINCAALVAPDVEHGHWHCVERLKLQRDKLRSENEELYLALSIIADIGTTPEEIAKARTVARSAVQWGSEG